MFINVEMPMIVGILTFMSMVNVILSLTEHEKCFITSGPGDELTGPIFEQKASEYNQNTPLPHIADQPKVLQGSDTNQR